MGREQNRKTKNILTNNKSNIFEQAMLMKKILQITNNDIQDGQKVKLNYDKITSHMDYERFQPKYKEYVEEHKDKVLKVKLEESYKDHTVVALMDGDEESIWRFSIIDLIKVD